MAMTPTEMISFFRQQNALFSGGIEIAAASRNYHLAVSNIGQVFKASIMQGLIGWRCGLESPVKPFQEATHLIENGIRLLSTFDNARYWEDLPCGSAGIISFLVGMPSPKFVSDGLSSELLLDAVLSDALRGSCNDSKWSTGLDHLRKSKRTALAFDSYSTYFRLLQASKAESMELIEVATGNFEKRRKDKYYSGGNQTEGGGPDNLTTIDYRLAAILKKLDYVGENPHRWLWS
jgi:hypothetical protein